MNFYSFINVHIKDDTIYVKWNLFFPPSHIPFFILPKKNMKLLTAIVSKIIKIRAEYFRNMTIIFIAPHDQRTHRFKNEKKKWCSTDSRLVHSSIEKCSLLLTSTLVNIHANASLLDKLYNHRVRMNYYYW
jgi:hypothetical protein